MAGSIVVEVGPDLFVVVDSVVSPPQLTAVTRIETASRLSTPRSRVIWGKVPFRINPYTQGPRAAIGLIHGFAQTRRCWGSLTEHLSGRFTVRPIDAPGHGEAAAQRLGLAAAAQSLADEIGPGIYLGYSMGGRLALHAALARPAEVRALVLVSATPGIESDDEREQRRRDDETLAAHIEAVGVERFVDEWLAGPLFDRLDDTNWFVEERRTNTVAGLASSLRLAGAGAQTPLWERLGEMSMPVLVVAGAEDAKYTDLAIRTAAAIGANATLAVIDGAGHSAHLERPDAFAAALDAWLAAVSTTGQ